MPRLIGDFLCLGIFNKFIAMLESHCCLRPQGLVLKYEFTSAEWVWHLCVAFGTTERQLSLIS